jgi:hypothetical protein
MTSTLQAQQTEFHGGRDGRLRRLLSSAAERPLVSTAVLAATVRVFVAVVSFVVHEHVLIPDEQQYIELAGTVARGEPADSWFPGYGQSLYTTTWTYTGVLARLYDLTGETPRGWCASSPAPGGPPLRAR